MTERHRQDFDRVLEALAEDIFNASDEEIDQLLHEVGVEPSEAAKDTRALVAAATAEVGFRRLAEARTQLDRVRSIRSQTAVTRLADHEKDAILRRFAASDKPLQERLTMAARNGGKLSESEVNSVLLDLVELGAIDSGGHDR